MYTVVICSNCQYPWIVEDRPERPKCGRCQQTRKFKKLKKYHETESLEKAKQVRTSVNAELSDEGDAFQRAKEAGALDSDVEQVLTDEEYLEQKGVDVAEVAAASERANQDRSQMSQREVVEAAIESMDVPTESEIRSFAEEYNVDGDKAMELIEKMKRTGTILGSPSSGYRRV